MHKINIITSAVISLILTLLVFFYFKYNENKMAYINISEVYNKFEMKKEFESRFLTVVNGRKHLLDSLEINLKIIASKLENKSIKNLENEFEFKKEAYFLKKQEFEEDNELMQNQYTENIMKQLNQYVQDYGKEKHYSFIFGAENSGSLMYSEDVNNISNEVIEYINLKYKGVK